VTPADPIDAGHPEEDGRVIPVEVLGRRYAIRSSLDFDYVQRLAAYVDGKVRASADATPSGDSLRVAVLAAFNIADELFRCREATRDRDGKLAERAGEIERLLDRALTLS
jgi:cell division protein ZapA